MKLVKKIFLIFIILTAVVIIFRGYLYRQLITYKPEGARKNFTATNKLLIKYIESNTENLNEPDIEEIIKQSLRLTSEHLNFTASKNEIDPNRLITTKTAHCVGYATFFATTCNYLLKKNNMTENWTAKPQRGQLYLCGVNIHPYFESGFFKDHDFVLIENKKTGQTLAVDPTVNDYFYIDLVSYAK